MVEEADCAVRLRRIQTLAEDTFESRDKAAAWLRRPLAQLCHQTPFDDARTVAGTRAAETILAALLFAARACAR